LSIWNFDTGNQYIDGKIEHSYTRTTTGYTVKYSVQMRRNNSWTGDTTRGNITYKVYINDKVVKTATKWFKVENGGAWCELVNGTHTISLDAGSSGSYTVGFSSSTSDGISAFKNSYKKSTVNKNTEIPVIMTNVGPPKVSITDSGKNSYVLTSITGSDGVANKAKNCYIVYTTKDKTSVPDKTLMEFGVGSSVIATEKTAGQTYSKTIPIEGPTTVRAFGRTLGSNPSPFSYQDSNIINKSILYYVPPKWNPNSVSLTYRTNGSTSNRIYTVNWGKASDGNSNSPLIGYKCMLYKNGNPILEKYLESTVCGFTFSTDKDKNNTDYEVQIKAGDSIIVTVEPYTYWGDNKTKLYATRGEYPKGGLTVKFPGLVKLKRTSTQWGESQVYVKVRQTNNQEVWKKSNGVYIKTLSGWKESI
jgi:hypothetical protein